MLPKVANQLLHHTTRAVAAVQNQTGHTIRNVLQLQSSSGPSSSNSGRSGGGTGSGGAKYHTGSRSYHGYNGAGRAVTQVESLTSNDVGQGRNDDSDESKTARAGFSARRKSISLGIQDRKKHNSSVFKVVQTHALTRRAFNDRHKGEPASGTSVLSSTGAVSSLQVAPTRPALVRHESTNSTQLAVGESPDALIMTIPHLSTTAKSLPEDSPEARLAQEPVSPAESADTEYELEAYNAINSAVRSGDAVALLDVLRKIRSSPRTPSPSLYNSVLSALYRVRQPGEPLQNILQIYNEMLARSVLPNFRTYTTLIRALTERDAEITSIVEGIQLRMRKRTAFGIVDKDAQEADERRIEALRSENNFRSAMTLFQSVCAIPKSKIASDIYGMLLRSCAQHANVDAAIHVFAHNERRSDLHPTAVVYQHLIRVYSSIGDLQGAREVFQEFLNACESGRLWSGDETSSQEQSARMENRSAKIRVWNGMIDAYIRGGQHPAALALLEQMLDTKAGDALDTADIPPPTQVTFHRIIQAFCATGDVSTALSWFNRLLQQDARPSEEPSVTPTRPIYSIYVALLDALAFDGRIDDLNKVYAGLVECAERDGLEIREMQRLTVLHANYHYLYTQTGLEPSRVTSIVDFLADTVLGHHVKALRYTLYKREEDTTVRPNSYRIAQFYIAAGRLDKAVDYVERYVAIEQQAMESEENAGQANLAIARSRYLVRHLMPLFAEIPAAELSLDLLFRLGRVSNRLGVPIPQAMALRTVEIYRASKDMAAAVSAQADWDALVTIAMAADKQLDIAVDILCDMAQQGMKFGDIHRPVLVQLAQNIIDRRGPEDAKVLLASIAPELVEVLDGLGITTASVNVATKPVRIDPAHSAYVDAYASNSNKTTHLAAYDRLEAGAAEGVYPEPDVIARLISTIGRLGHFDKMHKLYQTAQRVLASMELDKERQSAGWFQVEDHMIIGLAHAGSIDAAHVHRLRILENGGVPSADAYGALVHHVKDTTDDAQNAMALFQEARDHGVQPNLYLYNTIISKLARARRADDALALFQEMKAQRLWPSSVTYGAIIAACCRVGDATSAELLFQEMASQRNFKPRIPPYNTMMQLYTHTKPDRPRVLHYYNAMLAARVQPTAHTYKLLIDAYGSIEPVDVDAMENIFVHVTSGPHPLVQGTHWAALINAWGCVKKDLERATSIFDSIADHPSTKATGQTLPDAVVFEALINVLITLRRTDLLSTYVDRLSSQGIHMTAYIANLLIKGYASVGDIERARGVFENLVDPPEGIAAPFNHAPHDGDSSAPQAPAYVPVYREPSTWEAMVRAELGNSQRDRAVALLERAQARKFPPAVYGRISGIMLGDEPASPWATPSPSSSQA